MSYLKKTKNSLSFTYELHLLLSGKSEGNSTDLMNERSVRPAVHSVITEIAGVHNVPYSQSLRMSD